MKDDQFVRLTGEILRTAGLTSTDKIVLAYNRTLPTFFASNAHVASSVGMNLKTVEKSITKLRKMGLWREAVSYSGRRAAAKNPTGVGPSSYSGRMPVPTRVGDNKSISPLKTGSREERGEERLEETEKKAGEESAAGAANTDSLSDSLLKTKETQSDSESVKETKKSGGAISGGEASKINGTQGSAGLLVPLGADGRPMTREAMREANIAAVFAGKPEPFTSEQVKSGRPADEADRRGDVASEFEAVFGRLAG